MLKNWYEFGFEILKEHSIEVTYRDNIMTFYFKYNEDTIEIRHIFICNRQLEICYLILDALSEENFERDLATWINTKMEEWKESHRYNKENLPKIEDLLKTLSAEAYDVKRQAKEVYMEIKEELDKGEDYIEEKYCVPEEKFDW